MSRRLASLAMIALLLSAVPAGGLFGVIDDVPAATLLVPYFEVQVGSREDAHTTTFTVVNADEGSSVLAHVTLWTDLGLPTVNFTMFLQPLGSREIDLRALFIDGALPFAGFGDSCKVLSSDMPVSAADLRAAHTGQASDDVFGGKCGARETDDDLARGYVTVDTVTDCTSDTPFTEDYFMDDATAENVLTGHYTIRRDAPFRAVSAPAVHIEASAFGSGPESFYYRFGPVHSTADGREPLPVSTWSASYTNHLTDLICWTDLGLSNPFECESPPLVAVPQVTILDHRGDEQYSGISSLCALSTGRLRVAEMIPQAEAKAGSVIVELNSTEIATQSGTNGFTPRRQSHLSAIHRLHPLDLTIYAPGVANVQQVFLPLLSGASE